MAAVKRSEAGAVEAAGEIDDMLHRMEYKIGRYEGAMKTGKLVWDEPSGCDCMKD